MGNFVEAIRCKRDGLALSREQIFEFVQGAASGSIPDYQLSAMLMAIRLKGMDYDETANLTMAMAESGETLSWQGLGKTVDKHSTGGVGDTTTLVLLPLVAACGVPVAKLSGSALGHTGGTLDKLASIPGMRVRLEKEEFYRQVQRIGCGLSGQSANIAPADKTLYALRDVTATVDSLPLIVSSIVSKKLAAGCDAIVLDVKTGNGALLSEREQSLQLARDMVEIGCRTGRKFYALMTDMSQPLGMQIGNALEVEEAIWILQGKTEGPLKQAALALGARMLLGVDRVSTLEEGYSLLQEKCENGEGLLKFAQLIEAQGGNKKVVEDTSLLPHADKVVSLRAEEDGYLERLDAVNIGLASNALGAGRKTKTDEIDPAAGIVLRKRIGDQVKKGEEILSLHLGKQADLDTAMRLVKEAVAVSNSRVAPLILLQADISVKNGSVTVTEPVCM